MKWEGQYHPQIKVNIVPTTGISNHAKVESYYNNIRPYLKKKQFDCVVGFNRIPDLDIYFAADICYLEKIKSQRTIFSLLTPRYRLFTRFERALFAPQSKTEIIYLSKLQKSGYQKIYHTPDNKFHYAPPGVNKHLLESITNSNQRDTVRNELNISGTEYFLLMIGSNFKTKGVARSIKALASLSDPLREKTFLAIIGYGKEQRYLNLAKRLGVHSKVRFLGSREDTFRFLNAADIVLQPSLHESAGNVIVESLAAGVPVIATDTCGYAEHIKQSLAGAIIHGFPFAQEEFNDTLQKSLNFDTIIRMKKNALDYAKKTDLYSRTQVIADIIEKIAATRTESSRVRDEG